MGLGLVVVVAFMRLDAGAIELGWLQPEIEQALTPEGSGVTATVGRTELRLNDEARTLELVGVDVRYRAEDAGTASARPFLTFPEVQIRLSVEALLKKGMVAASRVVARAPSLIITRSEDGVIGLHSEEDPGGRLQEFDIGDFLRRFALSPDESERLPFLKSLQIGGGRVAYYDRDPRLGPDRAEHGPRADQAGRRRRRLAAGRCRAAVRRAGFGSAFWDGSARRTTGSPSTRISPI